MTFSTTGAHTKAQQVLAGQGAKAIFEIKRYSTNFVNIQPKILNELFDRLIEPIISYSSEVWGFHEAPYVERLHKKCCKWALSVKTSTPNFIARTELGRTEMKIKRYIRIIKYWMKILRCDDTRYINYVYKILLNDAENNKINWASHVKALLYSVGLGEVWFFQTVGNEIIFMSTLTQRLRDINQQTITHELAKSTRGKFYLSINQNLQTPYYLNDIKIKKHRIYLTKLRTSSHALRIETGRWKKPNKEPLQERICTTCNVLDDEYHFIMECSLHSNLRRTYIPRTYTERPSMYKFINMLMSEDSVFLKKMSTYVFKAFKRRQDLNSNQVSV